MFDYRSVCTQGKEKEKKAEYRTQNIENPPATYEVPDTRYQNLRLSA
jgi:hypothetical protein